MEPSEALSAAGQIAVALAGFAGVVVAFRSRSLHDWSLVDKFRLLNLLGNSLVALFSCLFGMLLLTIKPTPLSIWRWCSGFALLLGVCYAFLSQRRLSELGRMAIKEMGTFGYVFYLTGALGLAVGLLQVYNALVSEIFWLFYSSVIFQLAVGALQFARMIFQPPHTSKT
jgi:hypothetical protein